MDNKFEVPMVLISLVFFGYTCPAIAIFMLLLMSWGPSKKRKGTTGENQNQSNFIK